MKLKITLKDQGNMIDIAVNARQTLEHIAKSLEKKQLINQLPEDYLIKLVLDNRYVKISKSLFELEIKNNEILEIIREER